MTPSDTENAASIILSLLTDRAMNSTICPSEVARTLAARYKRKEWRTAMPVVHAAVDGLLHDGTVRLSWKGEAMEVRCGPYRIALSSGT